MTAHDFEWGKARKGIQLGLRGTVLPGESGKQVDLYAAVRNLSEQPVELQGRFGLAVQSARETSEHLEGPRSSTPVALAPGELQEILGWRLGPETLPSANSFVCWAFYRPARGQEMRSGTIVFGADLFLPDIAEGRDQEP